MSKSIEEELEMETKKWLERIEREIEAVEAVNKKGKEFFENIKAYISDSHYFLDRDLIRAFECVVWAWAWLEIGIELKLLKRV